MTRRPHGTPVVAIVGSGFSGTLVAVNLARMAGSTPIKILLCERGERFAQGVAYGTTSRQHLLNVPAGMMSALPDEAGHFLGWLQARDPSADAGTFAPRSLYGEYLAELLSESSNRPGAAIECVRSEVVDLRETSSGLTLHGKDGERIQADLVVLALGHAKPAAPLAGTEAIRLKRAYIDNPWSDGALDDLDPSDPIVLIGSGLTAVDLVAEARARGHRGPITLVSRHGFLPNAHRKVPAGTIVPIDLDAPLTARSLLAYLRREAERFERAGSDWRAVLDALRPELSKLWRAFGATERARFLRHLAPFWEVHRHRVAPELARVLDSAREEGQLRVIAGRLRAVEEQGNDVAVTFVRRGSSDTETVIARRVINCTGAARSIRSGHSPLLDSLIAKGYVRPDPLALGLEVAEGGAVVNAAGTSTERLFALGPLLKGELWESTAVRELRTQARDLAQRLVMLADSPAPARRHVA